MNCNPVAAWGLVVSLFCAGLGQTGPATVSGQVIDEAGKPLEGAEISFDTLGQVNTGILPTAVTDSQGKFTLSGIPPGRNRICASKDAAGYPETRVVGFADLYPPCPVVTVRPGESSGNLVIHLAPKAARLEGRVTDANGHPISNAGLGLLDAQGSLEFSTRPAGGTSTGAFSISVPFGKPFRFRVSAPGYETWYFGPDGTKAHAAPLHMKQGEVKVLIVRLQPLSLKSRP
jgi:carboxypeptidase family protein